MKKYHLLMVSACLAQMAMAQKPDIQQTTTKQVLANPSIKANKSLTLPTGPTAGWPAWMSDTSKRGSVFVEINSTKDKFRWYDHVSADWITAADDAAALHKTGNETKVGSLALTGNFNLVGQSSFSVADGSATLSVLGFGSGNNLIRYDGFSRVQYSALPVTNSPDYLATFKQNDAGYYDLQKTSLTYFARSADLAGYLPLTGGTLSGNLTTTHEINAYNYNGQFNGWNFDISQTISTRPDYVTGFTTSDFTVKSYDANLFPSGTGTANYLTKWTGAHTLGNSIISEGGGNISVSGSGSFSGSLSASGYNLGSQTYIEQFSSSVVLHSLSSSGVVQWNNFANTFANMILDDSGYLTVRGQVSGLGYKMGIEDVIYQDGNNTAFHPISGSGFFGWTNYAKSTYNMALDNAGNLALAGAISLGNTVSSSTDNTTTRKIKIKVGGTDLYVFASTSSL